jgi:hypothetical protein
MEDRGPLSRIWREVLPLVRAWIPAMRSAPFEAERANRDDDRRVDVEALANARREIETLRSQLADRDARIDALTERIAEAASSAAVAAEQASAEREDLRVQLAQANDSNDASAADADDPTTGSLDEALADREALVEELRTTLAEQREAIARRDQVIEDLRARLPT